MSDSSIFDHVRVVLARPSHPGNIGSAARAMKTMGFHRLYLVEPRRFPDSEATALASGAGDVLDAATVCSSLEDALAGCVFSAALTSRRRELAVPMRWVRSASAELAAYAGAGEVALVFGNETFGLSNDELALCHMPVMIPANPAYASLNLAAAVQLVCYELRVAMSEPGLPPAIEFPPASHHEVEGLVQHFEQALVGSGFLDPNKPRRLIPRLRRLFARARIEKEEVSFLRGALASLERKSD